MGKTRKSRTRVKSRTRIKQRKATKRRSKATKRRSRTKRSRRSITRKRYYIGGGEGSEPDNEGSELPDNNNEGGETYPIKYPKYPVITKRKRKVKKNDTRYGRNPYKPLNKKYR